MLLEQTLEFEKCYLYYLKASYSGNAITCEYVNRNVCLNLVPDVGEFTTLKY